MLEGYKREEEAEEKRVNKMYIQHEPFNLVII